MAKIGLVDVDNPGGMKEGWFNYALMKIIGYHYLQCDTVEWCTPLNQDEFDEIYASCIFTWNANSDSAAWLPKRTIKGGSGFDLHSELSPEIDACRPDYSIYSFNDYAVGYLTRGCIRRCEWCDVRSKEGYIKPYRGINDIWEPDRKGVILLDNNVLACDHGIRQIERIARQGIKVDFNQGLDARLIDDAMARLLSKVKWIEYLRMSCDTVDMIPYVQSAINSLRWHNCKPIQYFVYVLVRDKAEALEIVRFLKSMHCAPFLQNYVDREGRSNPDNLDLINWANRKEKYRACTFEEFTHSEKARTNRQAESKELFAVQGGNNG